MIFFIVAGWKLIKLTMNKRKKAKMNYIYLFVIVNSTYIYEDMYNDTIVVRVPDEYVACVAFTKPSAGSFSTITFFFNI